MLISIVRHSLLAGCIALSACGGDRGERAHALYLERLARTLDSPAPRPAPAAALPRLPRSGALRIDIPAANLGVLDFLDLRGCRLQATIGKLNSSLGRLAKDSQRLLLSLEYLQLAPPCIALLRDRGDGKLAATLAEAYRQRRQYLPAYIFNATLAGEEFQALWRPAPPPPGYPDNTSSAPISSLAAIDTLVRRWLGGDYAADNLAFELLLAEVRAGDAGQLWYSLRQQSRWLAQADALLQQRADRGPLCAPSRRDAAADILPRVVEKFFVGGVQARAAALGRRYHQLLAPIGSLEAQLADTLPPAYQAWLATRRRGMAADFGHPRRHVAALQGLLAPCQRNPR